MMIKKSFFGILLAFFVFVIVGCTEEKESQKAAFTNTLLKATEATEKPLAETKEDITFKDFNVPEGFRIERELAHAEGDKSYVFYEFQVDKTLSQIDQWLRNEAVRLHGKIIERYTYNTDSSVDLIIEVPSAEGVRIISTYTQKYMDQQHLIIEETQFDYPIEISPDYEDHALVIFTPDEQGGLTETYKGDYYHQHTDILSLYFYSHSFFNELQEKEYNIKVNYDMRTEEVLDYTVGYFDIEGKYIDIYSITDENRDEYIFGIQLENNFLPDDEKKRDQLLFAWAKTLLLGNKANSRVFDGSEEINFLADGDIFKSYTLVEVFNKGL